MSVTENKKPGLKEKIDPPGAKIEWSDVATQRAKIFAKRRKRLAKAAAKAKKLASKNRQAPGPTITPIFPEAKPKKAEKVEKLGRKSKRK